MGPLLFVNWNTMNTRFRGLMWLCVLVLAVVILIHTVPHSATTAHQVRGQSLLPNGLRGKP
jgi:hypothetical protein